MPDFDLSITICSWNTVDDLRACLASLRAAKDEANFEVVVVDNDSEDGSADMVAAEFPEFVLIRQEVNLGFTGGHNLAIKERKGRDVALLNSDTVVHPGAISAVSQFMRENPKVGVVGVKLLNPDGSLQMSCRRFPNPLAAAFRNTWLGRLFPNNRFTREYLMADFEHDKPREVDWVSGAAMFIRGELIDEIGLLDDDFFMYCEDVDFCRRAWDAGWKVMYLPSAVITHAIGRSSDKAPNRMIARFHLSMLRYYRKHDLRRASPFARPFMVAFAACALGLRATIFYLKNKVDVVRRRLAK
ncbi:MAG TPA: glycosyltransferase family 2 protein [Fimbriimonadaceae bacterium]|nr:glycosyltransferase family 2 protein [Fimbriimonadaceae bacterium]